MTQTPANPPEIQTLFAKACECHLAGQLQLAQHLYQIVLGLVPEHPDALHNLSVIQSLDSSTQQTAIDGLTRVALSNPRNNQYWSSLIDALIRAQHWWLAAQRLEDWRRATGYLDSRSIFIERVTEGFLDLARKSTHVPQKKSLDTAITNLFKKGDYQAMLALTRKALKRDPRNPLKLKALAVALMKTGAFAEASKQLLSALAINPSDPELYINLATAQVHLGRILEAEIMGRCSVALAPQEAPAHGVLALSLFFQDRIAEAADSFERAVQLDPRDYPSQTTYGFCQARLSNHVAASEAFRKALAIQPKHVDALSGLSLASAYLSDFDDTLWAGKLALEAAPLDRLAWERYLYALSYHPELSVEQIFAEFVRWGKRFAPPSSDFSAHDRTIDRPLRIGIVSPDFRRHTSRYYFEPLFSGLDRRKFELYAYYNNATIDDWTFRFQEMFENWRNISAMSDQEAYELIRRDQIDILLDACNHMNNERFGLMALKPAPVQATWLGSAWTSGLPTIDYAVFDRWLAPEGTLATEAIVRLPSPFMIFRKPDTAPAVSELPALTSKTFTFGYSGRIERLNRRTYRLWAKILSATPDSRLIIDFFNVTHDAVRDHLKRLMNECGMPLERVQFRCSDNIFEGLSDFDLILDALPHNGGTFLLDGLWMGVPFVTLAGRPTVGRIGSSICHALGMEAFVTYSEDEYVARAVALTRDLPSLNTYRQGLRQRMLQSSLMNPQRMVRYFGRALEEMWRIWAQGEPPHDFDVLDDDQIHAREQTAQKATSPMVN
jgi:predicted O-linked N-acetylglucosamine transferase (SPINDLY family)